MAATTADIFEQYGLTGELIYENALRKLLEHKATIEQALDYIMDFARGHWSLVIDENLQSLVRELERLNYDALTVPKGMPDDEIRRRFAGQGVFITANDRDFTLDEVPDPFARGMILVPGGVDARRLAEAVESVLMTWRKEHGGPVRHRIERADL